MCSQGVLARNLVGWGCFTAEQTDGETAPEEAPESVGGGADSASLWGAEQLPGPRSSG